MKVRLLEQVFQLLRRQAGPHTQVLCDVLQQLQHGRRLALREQVDLEIQMAAFVGLAREPVLAGKDEQGQEDRLQ
jgi:hypothetical protein